MRAALVRDQGEGCTGNRHGRGAALVKDWESKCTGKKEGWGLHR